ncbi:efflux RND transporter periplasmic adaptor subunit [Lichenifustis flavocetrariae]|uniref:Efflux RND transporter periplasmic adaptor subunit n=1 Tax=Lichenifustis flavocetrariae TaxID=2949735 RepID=A0AA41Z2M5_9HYPH|nr:efflux RND transporter periplasmic adaptor subunit [Lichenifustis flavocetrariae]MCW6513079.1 efflux RND transporter periplasmic adaptor subunit [Lichenifustis flavocetrariae]
MGRVAYRRAWRSVWATLALCLAACKPEAQPSATATDINRPSQTVAVAAVTEKDVPRRVSATGTVMPWQELAVDAQASGLAVIEVRVKENDVVKVGDVLIRLDDRVLQAQVAQQKAAMTEAQANLQSARKEASRGDALVVQKAMSQEAVETRRTAILTSQAKLDQAAASLDQLQAQLNQTVVRAPAGGGVSTEPVRLGTVTQSGTELLRLIREGRLEVQAKVPERELGALQAGQSVRVSGPDGSIITGTLRDVAAKVDASTRLGIAYVDVPSGGPLRAGMFASVSIEVETSRRLVVPERALVWPNGAASAFVLGPDDKVGLRSLVVTARVDGEAVVGSGVAAGERVVTAGAGFLHDGDSVRVQASLDASAMASP